ncbi:MAG: YraN family protein [Candidatus Andersenbacteria bacterium]|nr:YraN family protein [Candidatus Andersenbacteria bacterium]
MVNNLGNTGEQIARAFLEKAGFLFVDANWSCKLGEVDLIMRDKDELVFVEVRLRRPTSYGQGLDTVAAQKQRKLINTARFYQQKMDYWGYLRFDVVSIEYEEGQKPIIEHIQDAF